MLFSLFKTKGHSMEPRLKKDSYFFAISLPPLLFKPKKGDLILFKDKDSNKTIVKKIKKVLQDKYFVEGENRSDSKKYGPISASEILGKVVKIF